MNVPDKNSAVWADGSALTYTNWANTYPKNARPYAHIQLTDLQWVNEAENCLVLCVRTDGGGTPSKHERVYYVLLKMIVMMIMTRKNDGTDDYGYDDDDDDDDDDNDNYVNSTIVQEQTFIHILVSIRR